MTCTVGTLDMNENIFDFKITLYTLITSAKPSVASSCLAIVQRVLLDTTEPRAIACLESKEKQVH